MLFTTIVFTTCLAGCGPSIAFVQPVGEQSVVTTAATPDVFATLDRALPVETATQPITPTLSTEPAEFFSVPLDTRAQFTLRVARTPTFTLDARLANVTPLPSDRIYALWLVRIEPLDYRHVATFAFDAESRSYHATFISTEDWSAYTRAVVTRQPPGHRLHFSARSIVREIALTDS